MRSWQDFGNNPKEVPPSFPLLGMPVTFNGMLGITTRGASFENDQFWGLASLR